MTELYVLRHGIAVPAGLPETPDEERPLTSKGERRIRQIARGLRRLDLKLDRIVSSPAVRAWRTAEIAADVLGLTDVLEAADALRPDRDAASIREWLGTRTEQRLMIVGHNPSFSDLLGLLITGRSNAPALELRKGGIAAVSMTTSSAAKLEWLARPRLFRRLR